MSGARSFPTDESIKYPSGQPAPGNINFFTLGTGEVVREAPFIPVPITVGGVNDFSVPLVAAIL